MFSTRPLSFLSTSLLLRRGSRRAHISPDADTASSSSSTPFERDPRLPHALYVSDYPPQPQPQASSFPRLGLGERSLGERRDGTFPSTPRPPRPQTTQPYVLPSYASPYPPFVPNPSPAPKPPQPPAVVDPDRARKQVLSGQYTAEDSIPWDEWVREREEELEAKVREIEAKGKDGFESMERIALGKAAEEARERAEKEAGAGEERKKKPRKSKAKLAKEEEEKPVVKLTEEQELARLKKKVVHSARQSWKRRKRDAMARREILEEQGRRRREWEMGGGL